MIGGVMDTGAEKEAEKVEIIEVCETVGLTRYAVALAVAEGLQANKVKVQMKPDGTWSVSPKFTDHQTRLTAANLGASILGMKAAERIEHDVEGSMSFVVATEISKPKNSGR